MPHLLAGGAEQTLIRIANFMAEATPTQVATIRSHGSLSERLSSKVGLSSLGGRLLWPAKIIYLMHKHRPLAILSSAFDINFALLALSPLFPSGTRIVIREPLLPEQAVSGWFCAALLLKLYRRLYGRAEKVVLLSRQMAATMSAVTPQIAPRLAVIHNAPDPTRVSADALRTHHPPLPLHFVAVGRLVPQKGFDVLLQAFAQYLEHGNSAYLTIYGAGPEKAHLGELIDTLRIRACVSMPGYLGDIRNIASAHAYILSSRFEGLANSMVEALHMGLPVIATRKDTSADEFIEDGIDGILIPDCDVESIANALTRFQQLYLTFDRNAIARRARQHSNDSIMLMRYRSILAPSDGCCETEIS